MRLRLGLALLTAVAGCLAFTASASACQIANLVLSPKTVGPGDTVSYSISGIASNATYSFTIGGIEVSGTNDGSVGVDGTFTMPDLGSQALTADAYGTCSCPEDANSMGLHDSVTYLPPPTAGSPTSPAAENAPAASPTPAARSSNPKSRNSATPGPVAKHAAKDQRHDSAVSASAVGSAPADAVGRSPAPSDPSSGSGAANKSGGESSVQGKLLDAVGSTTKVGPADVPTIGLVLIALIFVAGVGLAAFVIYLLRRGPDPEAAIKAPGPIDPDPVEAELQEMIADEMARQLLSDLDLGEPTVTAR